ncbi:Nicotinate dehydrogenase subunit B [Hartmannibacter diazotrophicus]|uniref:Nicotinate dehydrogenase subunit B n=1 Tax=Hartmannibacter diazotrophicus TaxID=1482074 RepID=A0A2C9DC29_9HYPH|nr:molybdopterin cofactor-binding domain-containing protein [Hartmannibacter diazotrophicus]SON57688.1 Nicotinate dehydrogenase subunit B [Hartmannibacter diazotrophicus]
MINPSLARRDLLKAGGALVVAFAVPAGILETTDPAAARATNRPLDPASLDSWIAVSSDNTVTVYWGKMDMGQGTDTGIAIMAAEELDVGIDRVNVIQGDTALTVDQGGASGSTGVQESGVAIRNAAAEARRVLMDMAAKKLELPADALTVKDGTVVAVADASKSVTYGELVGNRYFSSTIQWNGKYGNSLTLKSKFPPKSPDQYTLVGTEVPRKDVPGKVMATRSYAHHMVLPGMLHGRMVRPPVAGAVPVEVDTASVAPFAAQVVWKDHFLGVVAEEEWDAIRASQELKVTWSDPSPQLKTTTSGLHDYIRGAKVMSEKHTTEDGDVDGAIKGAPKQITAQYEWPFQSHSRMAPAFGLADVTRDGVTVWTDSQKPHSVRPGVADVLGIPEENVRAIWMPGPGSYGRSDADDGAADAAVLSAAVGRPVRVQWMRHEGIAWDPKGVAAVTTGRAGLDADGNVVGYNFTIKAFSRSNMRSRGDEAGSLLAGHLLERKPENGYASRSPEQSYKFATMRYTEQVIDPLLLTASPLRTAHMRDPMGPEVHFGQESFIDEVALAANMDPVAFRLKYLTDPRDIAVVETAAKAAKWQTRVGPNPDPGEGDILKGRGIAYAQRGGPVNAVVAEVEVNRKTGRVWVRKFTVAADHGQVINARAIRSTIEGSVMMALSRTLFEEVDFDEAMVRSHDWDSYPIMEMQDIPEEVEIHLIEHPELGPLGAGESSTRIVPGAVANAFFDATGVRLRKMPMTPDRVLAALGKA